MTRCALRSFCIGAVTILLVACKPPPGGVTYSGGDGSTVEKAVIVNAANDMQGMTAEYVWLADHYPGFHNRNQFQRAQNGHCYDQMDIVTKDGQQRSVYFDISPNSGK